MDNQLNLIIARKDIAFLTKIMEGYDNLGLVSTVNAEEGLVTVHFTPGTEPMVRDIVSNLPFGVKKIPPW